MASNRTRQHVASYPLECKEGVFIERARLVFLRLAPDHMLDAPSPKAESQQVGELAGVCAFKTRIAAYRYGVES